MKEAKFIPSCHHDVPPQMQLSTIVGVAVAWLGVMVTTQDVFNSTVQAQYNQR